jgi:AbiV family abortive infection protein
MPVSSDFILRGGAYALEQCGFLLRDANSLYREGAYANAIVLTAFAREELGRSSILLGFWRETFSGKSFTIEDLRDACDDHVAKQRAGMLSLALRADRESGLGKILEARMKNSPQSAEWKEAETALKRIDETKEKRTPNDRHAKRAKALYVEPTSETAWNRPTLTSATEAYDFLIDAVNDYSGRYHQGYISPSGMLEDVDPQLYEALSKWPERPALWPPEHPKMPT